MPACNSHDWRVAHAMMVIALLPLAVAQNVAVRNHEVVFWTELRDQPTFSVLGAIEFLFSLPQG